MSQVKSRNVNSSSDPRPLFHAFDQVLPEFRAKGSRNLPRTLRVELPHRQTALAAAKVSILPCHLRQRRLCQNFIVTGSRLGNANEVSVAGKDFGLDAAVAGLPKKDASLSFGCVRKRSKEDKDASDTRSRVAVCREQRRSPQDGTRVSAKYKGVSRILDAHPEVLQQVHEDLKRLSCGGRKGRNADFSSETILRALMVHTIEGGSLRETVVRIAESDFLQDFLRSRKKAVMDHSFLDRCFQAVRPATWKQVNAASPKPRLRGERSRVHDPRRYDGGRDEHPLADRRLAVVGHLVRGGAAAASRATHRGRHLPASFP